MTFLPPLAHFGDDVAFMRRYTDLIVLGDEDGARLAVAPAWQGRVMTSSGGGEARASFGWINRALIAARTVRPHINPVGGEDRFWLGPEGGQFSVFFAPGTRFQLADWHTPAAVDSLPWTVAGQSAHTVKLRTTFPLINYSGTRFDVLVDREVRLLPSATAWDRLGVKPAPGVEIVAYESDNRLTNRGTAAWRRETGLLSIWIPGMFTASPETTVVVPITAGPESQLGRKVTADYFGAVPAERLQVTDEVVYFRGDGGWRSKIGISPRRSKGVLGSYDPAHERLTIVQFSQPAGATDYVNSLWQLQQDPYGGDAANSYNDGPPEDGSTPLGAFYELESSSPAAALAPGERLLHVHRTIHLSGPAAVLDETARRCLGASLAAITAALTAGR